MASWKEIEEIKRDPAKVRALSNMLLATAKDLTAWEEPFVEGMADRREPLSTRQAEKLLEIRDDAKLVPAIRGFSVGTLLRACWEARLDLGGNDDIEWLEKLKATGSTTIKHRDACRLLSCARELGAIDS